MLSKFVACAALPLALGAQAATVSGSASLHGFSFVLIDLDAADGVSPSITNLGAPGSSTSTFVSQSAPASLFDGHSGSGQAPWGSYTVTSSLLGGQLVATGGASSDGSLAGTVLRADGSLSSPDQPTQGQHFQSNTAIGGIFQNSLAFTLSPNTELVFSALLDASLAATPIDVTGIRDYLDVRAVLGFRPMGTCFTSTTTEFSAGSGRITGSGGPQVPTPPFSVSNVLVTTTCRNTSPDYVEQQLYVSLSVNGHIEVAAVPEPNGLYTILAGGLVVLTLRSRRTAAA